VDREIRENLFLSATVEEADWSCPVRIRNLSTQGSMIDGDALPDVGSVVILRRLQVSSLALVVWQCEGRCGLSFEGPIMIEDWVAGVPSSHRTASIGQARVDALQAAIRAGQDFCAAPTEPTIPSAQPTDYIHRVALELDHVNDLLASIGEALADDEAVLTRHAAELQKFDLAAQIVEHLQTVICSDDHATAIRGLPMHDLRNRLLGIQTIK